MTAQHVLDQVQSLAHIEALAADPARYVTLLAAELPPAVTLAELEARDAALAAALGQIDTMIARVMRVRLEHALAADSSIGPPTRTVFASTIVGYAGKLPLLAQRARDVAERGRAADPDRIADVVVEAAGATLALRDAVRAGVLALIRELETATIADADRHARDRKRDDAERRRWSAVRRDAEIIAADPTQLLIAPLAKRLAAQPEQLDEPEPEREVTFADLIELD